MIKSECKCCKKMFVEYKPFKPTVKEKVKEGEKYCLTCGFKKYAEKCREERRIALGLK